MFFLYDSSVTYYVVCVVCVAAVFILCCRITMIS